MTLLLKGTLKSLVEKLPEVRKQKLYKARQKRIEETKKLGDKLNIKISDLKQMKASYIIRLIYHLKKQEIDFEFH
jgi:hypothetical protein